MITHLVRSGSLFVLQWRDFLHIGLDSPCLSHKSRNDHESKWKPLWRENFPRDRDFHNRKTLRECPEPSHETVVESNENECLPSKTTPNMQINRKLYANRRNKAKPFNFHSHRPAGQNGSSNANQWEVFWGYKFRLLSPMRYRLRHVDFYHAYCTDKYFAMPLNIVVTVDSFSPVVQGEPERQDKISVHL